MKKIILLIFLLSLVFNNAQSLEYNAHMSVKYNTEKGKWENNDSEGNFKTAVNIDDFNRLINVNYIGIKDQATLELSVIEKAPFEDGSIMYVCKGIKSDVLDKVLITFNKLKTEMSIMYKCKEDGNCGTATYHTNK